jgi:hypothetical protein
VASSSTAGRHHQARHQVAGAASTSLAMRPVAQTLGELADLLGRRGAAAEHFAEAVSVAQAWQAPHWEAGARAALAASAGAPSLTRRWPERAGG